MRYAVYNFIPGPYIPEDEPQVKQERPEEKMPLYYNVILPRYRGLAPLAEEYARRQRERNFFEDGGDKSGYNGLIYNPVEEWDYKQNNIGEVLYPSFEEWSNGNKYNAKLQTGCSRKDTQDQGLMGQYMTTSHHRFSSTIQREGLLTGKCILRNT